MKIYRVLFFMLYVAGFFSCSEDDTSDEDIPNRTILVYMAGENSLSDFALADFQEMAEGMEAVEENNHLLVYLDTKESSQLPAIYHLYKDKKSGLVNQETVYTYPEQDDSSVTVERMEDVFRRAFEEYPAESYGLILWSHGEGWLPGTSSRLRSFGQDGGSSGPVMEIADLDEAISLGTTYLGEARHFDFIYFDACFMQGIEVAYQLRNYTDYLIGCPLETPGPGAPYDQILSPLFETGEADAVGMAQTYYQIYADAYDGGQNGSNDNWTFGAAISVVRTDALSDLAGETGQLYGKYADSLAQLSADDLASVQFFDYNRRYGGVYKHAYYDFGDFIHSFVTTEEYDLWEQQLNQAVVYAASTPTCYSMYYQGGGNMPILAFSGLSTYIPLADAAYAEWNAAYAALDWAHAVQGD